MRLCMVTRDEFESTHPIVVCDLVLGFPARPCCPLDDISNAKLHLSMLCIGDCDNEVAWLVSSFSLDPEIEAQEIVRTVVYSIAPNPRSALDSVDLSLPVDL